MTDKPMEVHIPQPPAPANRYLRYFLGFGVGAMVALAPYLGLLDVPGFRSLLSLVPIDYRDTLLPVAGAVAGIIAVVVQWYGRERLSRVWLRRNFRVAVVTAVLFLIGFLYSHRLNVVTVPFGKEGQQVSFSIGTCPTPHKKPCEDGVSKATCIERLTFKPTRIRDFWGDECIDSAQTLLLISYCLFLAAFGWLVAVVFLRDELERKGRPRRAASPL